MLPNVIIAGAPRCGTTSLFNYLSDHPEVCGSSIKETNFFVDPDFHGKHYHQQKMPNYHRDSIDKYIAYFEHCSNKPGIKVYLEATADYIYQQTPLEILSGHDPKPLVIFLLRKPSERIYSYFNFAKKRLSRLPKATSFEAFMQMVKSGDPALEEHKNLAHIIEYSIYYQYITRYEAALGKENIFIGLFEAFKADPLKVIRGICRKMDIDDSFYEDYDFRKANESYSPRYQFLHDFYNWLPIPYKLRYEDNPLKMAVKKVYYALNVKKNVAARETRSEQDKALLQELDHFFLEHNRKLESGYGVDLSVWQAGNER